MYDDQTTIKSLIERAKSGSHNLKTWEIAALQSGRIRIFKSEFGYRNEGGVIGLFTDGVANDLIDQSRSLGYTESGQTIELIAL